MKFLIFFSCLFFSSLSFSKCPILNSQGKKVSNLNDGLFLLITKQSCPHNIYELRHILKSHGLHTATSMVANRGRNNPILGSFSFFEVAYGELKELNLSIQQGEFFFGHFTQEKNGKIQLDQFPHKGKLIIELMAWDYEKKYFNFYELIGQGSNRPPQWFYRGDTHDAYLDNHFLKRQPNPTQKKFGKRMRCSACHVSGGPIMKELKKPHNDWWTTQRPLYFKPNNPSYEVQDLITGIIDAQEFSKIVKMGMEKLKKSPAVKKIQSQLSFQEKLRPLFCTTEVNLVSADHSIAGPLIKFMPPSSYWVNPMLAKKDVQINKKNYLFLLKKNGISFPETNHLDADHPWLAPVKGEVNQQMIMSLIDSQQINREFALDVLAIDFQNPLFSIQRCELLSLLPEREQKGWKKKFINHLKKSSLPGSQTLFNYLTDPTKNQSFHKRMALNYLNQIQQKANTLSGLEKLINSLQKIRKSVFLDEISQNPLGQILEPGFRVIFPK